MDIMVESFSTLNRWTRPRLSHLARRKEFGEANLQAEHAQTGEILTSVAGLLNPGSVALLCGLPPFRYGGGGFCKLVHETLRHCQ